MISTLFIFPNPLYKKVATKLSPTTSDENVFSSLEYKFCYYDKDSEIMRAHFSFT